MSLKDGVRIGVDGRMHAHSGIGRYVTSLLRNFPSTHVKHLQFVIYSSEKFFEAAFEHIKTKSKPLSFSEQFDLPIKKFGKGLDLFHSPQFNIPVLSGIPQVTTIHDCAYSRFPQEFSSLLDRCLYTLMFRLSLQRSTRIIAVSHATKHDIQKIYGISGDKISVVHEGVDKQFFEERPSDPEFTGTTCILEPPFMLFVGIPRPRKNLERILRAFSLAMNRIDKRTKLVIAGPEDNRFLDIKRLAVELNIDSSLVLAGRVSEHELRSLYRSAQCLLFPTLYEGFGLPMLEAMACSTPVIASSMPAHNEIAGEAALFVNPLDIEEIADAIAKMAEDSRLREQLILKGKERIELFSWENCAKQTLSVYDRVLNG
jgi:glycosyltransferase involved in cell wall biosynthesis